MRSGRLRQGTDRNPGSVSRRLLAYLGVISGVVVVVVAVVGLTMCEKTEERVPADSFTALEERSDERGSPDQRPQVEVLNGCGVSGIAATCHEYLKQFGFDVVNVENAQAFDYTETIVIDRGGDEQVARRLARVLGTGNVIRQVRPDLILQVTVILGADYEGLNPYGEIEP
ncbi:LytR C-terminal domain-containing protein [Gemmatimonadota bacterium]